MRNLDSLLRPRSVAVVGASESSWYGRLLLENIRACGFQGRIFPVNPKYDQVLGLKCYPSISAIREAVDSVVVAVAKRYTLDVLQDAANSGVRAAVVLTSGFGEGGNPEGRELEAKIRSLAQENGMSICGPNCLGLINVREGVATWGGPNPHRMMPGPIGAAMQSGNFTITFSNSMVERGLGLSLLVSAGNSVCLDVVDYIEYMLEDPDTRIIVGYVEGFKDGKRFLEVAGRAASLGKPIVLMKLGRSRSAARAALGHTGSLVGSDPVHEAALRQKGVIRVFDLDELVETVTLLCAHSHFDGGRVGGMSISGGEAAIMADLGEGTIGLEFPELSLETEDQLKKSLPGFIILRNPLDSAGTLLLSGQDSTTGPFAQCIQALASDPAVDLILVSQDCREQSYAAGKEENELFRNLARAVAYMSKRITKPIICLSPVSGEMDLQGREILEAAGVPLLQGLRPSLQALANVIRYSRFQALRKGKEHERASAGAKSKKIRAKLEAEPRHVLPEHTSAAILSQYEIPVAKSRIVRSERELAESVNQIGVPVVMKAISDQIAHRTDIGGVVLGVATVEAAVKAYREILANVRRARPTAHIEGVLVEETIPDGVEVIVGIFSDPDFGPTILFGMGGIFVEVLQDVALRVPPLTRHEARSMIEEIKGYPLLAGIRGGPRRDVEALTDVLLCISDMACDLGDLIEEVDINPLMVLEEGKGVKAADALIVLKEERAGKRNGR